ncbi:MAG: ferrous iron transport protein B, partial [Actinobacteria bacterium]
ITALITQAGPWYSLAYLGFLVLVFGAVGAVLNRLVPGQSTDLLIDLPSLRVPRLDNIVRKTGTKVWHFMKEVTLFFAAGAVIISVLLVTGALDWIIQVAQPLTVNWLGLPAESATAFVMGFVRRDFGAAGFFQMNLTQPQLLVAMVTITLFVPCIASAMVILKERGTRYFVGLFVGSIALAFFLGGLLWHFLVLIGVA